MPKGTRKETGERIDSIATLRALGYNNDDIAHIIDVRLKLIENYVWRYGITHDGLILFPNGKHASPAATPRRVVFDA